MAVPPPPDGQVLSLVGALSSPENHTLHVQAIRARDEALSASTESYGHLCFQLACLLGAADDPESLFQRIDPYHLEIWQQNDPSTASKLQQQPQLWIPFGQMAGFVLKQALLSPPLLPDGRSLSLQRPYDQQVKDVLMYCLGCRHAELRAVASTVVATTAVSVDSVQPRLFVSAWPELLSLLIQNLGDSANTTSTSPYLIEGSLVTIRKIMEDGPHQLRQDQLDAIIPVLLRFLSPTATPRQQDADHQKDNDSIKFTVAALQSIVACLKAELFPSALVAHFNDYLAGLSQLAAHSNPSVRLWVCRSIVVLLSLRTEYVAPHMPSIAVFMLQSTHDLQHPQVALEACEFWLVFANLSEEACTNHMITTISKMLPQLIPLLLRGMVYLPEQQQELLFQNEMDFQQPQGGVLDSQAARPVFHKSRAKKGNDGGESDENDSQDEDDDDDDDMDGNQWTLRKCAAASLDSLANLYGPDPILPCLMRSLEKGLTDSDVWIQEASILALGAIAEGCREAMSSHMGQLVPYLLTYLAAPESPAALPQLKATAAWTLGRYAPWAVSQVQSGAQGHLLAHMTEVLLERWKDRNRRVQVACCSAFGVLVESAGDLMVPYLEPIFQNLVAALGRFQNKSLLIALDTLGILADYVGPAIGEGTLPGIYIPPLLHMWDTLAKQDPMDRTQLPLMESLASIALVCGNNFQPYALETFDNAMCIIESVTLMLTSSGEALYGEEDVDPIVCAADLLDGLIEGLGQNFPALVSSSQRYGPHFLSMLHQLAKHEIASVRMSAFAILGDLARNAPVMLEPALPELLKEAITCLDPIQPSVCNNAVWAIGEVCVRCGQNPAPLKPSAATLVQSLMGLLMGCSIPGLVENAAATMGRLAKVEPSFVSADLPHFLLKWCDGMAKISDATERRDAYEGFIRAVYANPHAIEQASSNPADSISSILFAIVSWHLPSEDGDEGEETTDLLRDKFQPFPPTEAELGAALTKLVQDIKASVNEETWKKVQSQIPVNVRLLLREAYHI